MYVCMLVEGTYHDRWADILAPPSEDAAASKKHSKRIAGARKMTANEYTSRLKEEERKKKEVAEEKERKKVQTENTDAFPTGLPRTSE